MAAVVEFVAHGVALWLKQLYLRYKVFAFALALNFVKYNFFNILITSIWGGENKYVVILVLVISI